MLLLGRCVRCQTRAWFQVFVSLRHDSTGCARFQRSLTGVARVT